MRLSYSKIDTYQRCPHKYELAHVQKIPVPEPGIFALGSSVHDALKFMHQPGRLELPSQEDVVQEFCRVWENRQESVRAEEREGFFESGVGMLQRHYARVKKQADGRITADVERNFSFELDGGHTIVGRIDRVDVLEDGSIEVIDYKTGRKMPTQVDVDRDLQLAIYQMATQELLFPDKNVAASLYYLHHGIVLTAKQVSGRGERTRQEIMVVVSGIEAEEFEPKVDNHCDWCEYRNYCRVFRPVKLTEKERADIDTMVKELAQVDGEIKSTNAQSKRLKERRGELEATILEWMYHAGTRCHETAGLQALGIIQSRISFPPEAMREILEPLGLWDKVAKVSVTKSAIERLIRSGEIPAEVVPQLWNASEKRERNVVKVRRVGDEEEIEEGEE